MLHTIADAWELEIPMTDLPVWYLEVSRSDRLTPHMVRIHLTGDDLAGLTLTEPDQQVKLYFPRPGQERPVLPSPDENTEVMGWYAAYNEIPEDERPWMRSYTIRQHDPATNTIAFDFVLHKDAGPATRWALEAKPGDVLGVFGPSAAFARTTRLSSLIGGSDWVVLAGDDAAIPAIGTVIESLPAGKRALAFLEVAGADDEHEFLTAADLTTIWIHRGTIEPGRGDLLLKIVKQAEIPAGDGFAFVAAEAGTARQLRRHLVQDRGMPKQQVDFSGYWRLTLTQDDPPTPDDMTEAQERLADFQAAQSN